MEDMLIVIYDFIIEEALIVVPVLWVLGRFIKKSQMPDSYIVWILLVLGVGFTLWIMGISPEAVMQGVLVTGAAVFGHQLLKQTAELLKK